MNSRVIKGRNKLEKGAVLIITTITLALCALVCALLSIFVVNAYKVSINSALNQKEKIVLECKANVAYYGLLSTNELANQIIVELSNLTYGSETFSVTFNKKTRTGPTDTYFHTSIDGTHYTLSLDVNNDTSYKKSISITTL